MARKKKGKKGRTVSIDFSEAGAGRIKEEGDCIIKPVKLELEDGDKAQYLSWEYEVTKPKSKKGATLYNNTSLSPKSLWALRDVLEAHGVEVPESTMDLDLDEILESAEPVGCCVELETFQGKKRAKITDIFSAEDADLEGGDGDKDDDDKEDGDDLPDEDEVNEMDEDELEECVDDHDLDVDLNEVKGKGKKKLAAQRKAVIEALEEKDEEGSDAEEGYTKEAIMEMKAKELEKVVEEHDLEVELEGKLKKKRNQLVKALEEEDLLVEEEE